ncbi:helix-turn-helix domain-containing protein [Streptomyces sp900116325]|uniref:helix-turn-helix domain-containing protein n=1 Tax=Streptomyces sp. 900116325 TaxID=3154295 RepID=UPI00331F5839
MTTAPAAKTGEYLTTGAAARRIGVTAQYIRELADSGHLPGTINVGTGDARRLRVPEAALNHFLANALIAPTEETA